MPKSVATPLNMQTVQHFLPGFSPVQDALAQLAQASGEERGAVFTRREVVEFILDLSGYTTDVSLHHKRLLEPSFGGGEFLAVAVERLLTAYQAQESSPADIAINLQDAVRAVELHQESFVETRNTLLQLLTRFGLSSETAQTLLRSWLVQGDFLLEDFPFAFSHIVGNPPYVRHELIPDELMTEYRKRFHSMFKFLGLA